MLRASVVLLLWLELGFPFPLPFKPLGAPTRTAEPLGRLRVIVHYSVRW